MKTKSLLGTSFALLLALTSAAQWYTQAPMTTARGQHGAVAHPNGNVYVWGGFVGSTVFTSLEIYNQASNTWTTGAPIPVATRGMAFVLGLDSMIYSFCGYNTGYLSINYRYNVNTNAWTALTPPPVANWEATAALGPNGKIYLIGGEASMNLVQIYNPATDTWSSGAPLPVASRMHSAITAPNGKIYVIGGWNGSTALPDNQIYDPLLNSWSTGAPLPTPRDQFGATLSPNGKIYIIGGKNSGTNNSGPFFNNTEVYDPVTDTWTTDFALPALIGETEAVTTNGGINLFGGTTGVYLTSNYRLDLLCGTLGVNTSVSSTTICIGQNDTLTASAFGGAPSYTYQWSTGATTSGILVNPAATTSYTVTVTDSLGCVHTSLPIIVTVNPPLNVTASGNDTVCSGASVNLTANGTGGDGNYTYNWTPALPDNPIVTTTYSVVLGDGCGSPPASATFTVVINPLPVLTLAAQQDTVCINSTINILFGTPSGGTYFGTGVGGNNFNASVAGVGMHSINYRYTAANGCTDTITISVYVDLCTGIETAVGETGALDIFPNPVINELIIQNTELRIESVAIYDLLGQIAVNYQPSAKSGQPISIDVSFLSPGIYFVGVRDEENNLVTRKIVKM